MLYAKYFQVYRHTITILPLLPVFVLLIQNSISVSSMLGVQEIILDTESKVKGHIVYSIILARRRHGQKRDWKV